MSIKKTYFGTNLKMFKTNSETLRYLSALSEASAHIDRSKAELFVIPSYTALAEASALVDHRMIKIGAQNMHWAEYGQYTGEVSPLMLKELGIDIVELGHSERRSIFGETDFYINKKVLSALGHGFTSLLCIGETGDDKASGRQDLVLSTQLKSCLFGVSPDDCRRIWIAYEPAWSIGVNGQPAAPDYVARRIGEIRRVLCELFRDAGADIPVLYGGSVNIENAGNYIALPGVSGLFIGRSAWEAEKFVNLIDKIFIS